MFLISKRPFGWIFGSLLALMIVVAVRFFEKRIRFDTRRNAAWRFHTAPEATMALPPPEPL